MISVILCFHTIGVLQHLIDPFSVQMDMAMMTLHKVLSALPSSQPFSLQLFRESWNEAGKIPKIYAGYSDIAALVEGLIANLQLKYFTDRPPFFTRIFGSFNCPACDKTYDMVLNWENQTTENIILLQLPDNEEDVDVYELYYNFLTESFTTRCDVPECRNVIHGGIRIRDPGLYTVIAVNRLDIDNPSKKLKNRLKYTHRYEHEYPLLGKLVSVACHRGDVEKGHFISYHLVDDQWYLNNDSQDCTPCNNPLSCTSRDETIELLFFQN